MKSLNVGAKLNESRINCQSTLMHVDHQLHRTDETPSSDVAKLVLPLETVSLGIGPINNEIDVPSTIRCLVTTFQEFSADLTYAVLREQPIS